MLRTTLRVISYGLLFCTAATLRAQTPTIQPRFALEIQGPPGFVTQFLIIQEGQGVQRTLLSFSPSLPRLDGLKAANNKSAQGFAIELEYKMNGDMVEITASVVVVPINERGPNGSLEGRSTQSIGTYSARLSESIVLDKMEDLGLHPWTITVVRAQLPHPTSLGNVSRVPSIQVEILGEDRAGYQVSLHNLSSQGVTAFVVVNSFHDANTRFSERSGRDPVILVGASHEFHFRCDSSGSDTSNGAVAAPCTVVLEAALFADGSYEGDASAAASMESARLTKASQSRRVQLMVQSILADSTIEESSQIARIRSELTKLSAQPDPAILDQLRLKFPGLSPSEWTSVSADMKTELALQERLTLGALQEFETSTKSASSTQSLAQWWSAWERTQ
jgi:hypothetical protein